MNHVILTGRLVKDPEVRYTANQTAVCSFVIAVDRPTKAGEEKKTDFPRLTAFGKTAESMEKYAYKGQRVGIHGSVRTGSYENKNGEKVYTTDFLVSNIEYHEWKKDTEQESPYDNFSELEGDMPF